MTNARRPTIASPAFRFVFMMGVVNLFADMTYEGGASINGPFLATLGASAAAVSIVAGLGEFLGYSLRSVSGYVSDKTKGYWLVTFIGYVINLLAVPALALSSNWPMAAALYGRSRTALISFSVAIQLVSIPIFLLAKRTEA